MFKEAMQAVLDSELTKNKRYDLMHYLFQSILTETREMSEEETKDYLQRKLESLNFSFKRNDGVEFDDVRSRYWLSGRIKMVQAALDSFA